MIDGLRLSEAMARQQLSQSELARRVGVSQATISRALKGKLYSTGKLVPIAREVGVTPAFLVGESDDPGSEAAAAAPQLDAEQRELVAGFTTLDRTDRRAFSHLVRSLARRSSAPRITPMPERRALAAMFRALLEALPPEATWDDQAWMLADAISPALAQLVDIVPEGDAAEEMERTLTAPQGETRS